MLPFINTLNESKSILTINQLCEISTQKIFDLKHLCKEYFTIAYSVNVKLYYIVGVSWVTLL